MTEAKLIENVEGLGDIYLIEKPFDKQLDVFNKIGIKYPTSVRDTSYLRLKGNCRLGTRTCHAPIYAKDSRVIIARVSPLVTNLEMAEKAVQAHRNNNYSVFDKSIYGKWEKIAQNDKTKKPENRNAIFLSERNDYKIHEDSDEARFLFQDTRKDYFNKFVLRDSIQSCQINPETVDSQDGTIVNYLWFGGPGGSSYLDFRDRDLYFHLRAFGVLKKASEAGSKKFSSFSYNQVEYALKIVLGKEGLTGLEKKIIRPTIRELRRKI